MAKKYCNVCEHECHCVGKGYFIQIINVVHVFVINVDVDL
jgi:hypothetical protein